MCSVELTKVLYLIRSLSAVLALCNSLLLSALDAFATEEALFASVLIGITTGTGPESGPKGGGWTPWAEGGEVRRMYLAAASIASLGESNQSNRNRDRREEIGLGKGRIA